MLQNLRPRPADEAGFTLIELLVVILIIGILAAIAIPSFLNQTGKAHDSGAKEVARSAETAEEAAYTETQAYVSQATGAGPAGPLNAVEATLVSPNSPCVGSPPFSVSPCGLNATAAGAGGYTIRVTSRIGVVYQIMRNAPGTITRTCIVPAGAGATGGCDGVVAGVGSW